MRGTESACIQSTCDTVAVAQLVRELVVESDALAGIQRQRLARFDAARQAGQGLVEVVRFSLPGECAGGLP